MSSRDCPERPAPGAAPAEVLSEREYAVVRLLADGVPVPDVGRRLGLGEAALARHLSAVLGKLAAVTRTQAVDQAHRRGLL
jgi:DNA-binding NarL/FixJ family response regulator